MEDSPTMVKMDQGENQVLPSPRRRCLPKALGYITGDMKEFASWLKGIYVSLRWGDGGSSFGGNSLLVLLLLSFFIVPCLLLTSLLSSF